MSDAVDASEAPPNSPGDRRRREAVMWSVLGAIVAGVGAFSWGLDTAQVPSARTGSASAALLVIAAVGGAMAAGLGERRAGARRAALVLAPLLALAFAATLIATARARAQLFVQVLAAVAGLVALRVELLLLRADVRATFAPRPRTPTSAWTVSLAVPLLLLTMLGVMWSRDAVMREVGISPGRVRQRDQFFAALGFSGVIVWGLLSAVASLGARRRDVRHAAPAARELAHRLRGEGATLRAIDAALVAAGHAAPGGGAWTGLQLRALVADLPRGPRP